MQHSVNKVPKYAVRQAIDFVLPPRCPVSGAVVDAPGMIAPAVWADIDFIVAPFCACCGQPFGYAPGGDENANAAGQDEAEMLCASCLTERPVYETARAALAYGGVARDMVLRFKHADQLHMVHNFVPWLMRAGADMLAGADMIVPVPLHRWRLLRRRYNQAGLLALALARRTGLLCYPDGLCRQRATASQGHMGAKERRKNVKNAFSAHERYDFTGRIVVLVDDVYTTGATVTECARALYKAGAAKVHVLTLARVVRGDF